MASENDWEWEPPSDAGEEPEVDETSDADDLSPYEPPESAVTDEGEGDDDLNEYGAPAVYSPSGISVGTFLGGPVAATILFYLNFSKLGWDDHARSTLAIGGVATAFAFTLGFMLPGNAGSGLTLVWVATAFFTARHYQQQLESRYGTIPHISNWNAAGIGCLALLGVMAFFFVVFFMVGVGNF